MYSQARQTIPLLFISSISPFANGLCLRRLNSIWLLANGTPWRSRISLIWISSFLLKLDTPTA